jgi:hypothetical protein
MKHSLVYRLPVLEMLDNDALEQRGGHSRIPDPIRVNDDDRAVAAHAEARRLAPLHTLGPEEEILSLEQLREQRINLPPASVRRAETTSAHQHVA